VGERPRCGYGDGSLRVTGFRTAASSLRDAERFLVASSGPAVAPRHAFGEDLEIGVEPDRDAAFEDELRVASFMKAPPPVAITLGGPSIRRAITRRSPSRKLGSPKRSNISAILWSAASSISSSESANGRPSRFARRRPTVDLPAPISPTSTIDLRLR
jgi:hypothetical protein